VVIMDGIPSLDIRTSSYLHGNRIVQRHIASTSMTNHCKNCQAAIEGRYCSNCGQATSTARLDLHVVWHDLQHGLLHVHKGIFYTLRELFLRPGLTIRSYLDGQRIRHFQPLSMVIVLAALYAWLRHLAHSPVVTYSGNAGTAVAIAADFIEHHYGLAEVMLLPVLALCSYLFFRGRGERYVEWIVVHAFLASQRLVVQIIALPFAMIFSPGAVGTISFIINMVYLGWTMLQFYPSYRAVPTLLRSYLAMALALGIVLLGGAFLVLAFEH